MGLGYSTPESGLAPAKTSLFEVRLEPARAAEQGPLRAALPAPSDLAAELRGFSGRARVTEEGPLLSVDPGIGDMISLLRLDDGRALLLGYDEDDQIHFGASAAYLGERDTDLCDKAPAWWRDAIDEHCPWVDDPSAQRWVSQLFAWDGTLWQRSDVGPDESGLVRLLEVLRGG